MGCPSNYNDPGNRSQPILFQDLSWADVLLKDSLNSRPHFDFDFGPTWLPYPYKQMRWFAVTDKQIALLVSVLSMLFLVLSVTSIVIAISVGTELKGVNAQLSQQSAEIQQLTANQITMASMIAAPNEGGTEEQVPPGDSPSAPANAAVVTPKAAPAPVMDLPPQRVPVSVDLTRNRQSGKPQANASTEGETILAAVQPPVTSPKAQTSIYQAAEKQPEAQPKKPAKLENVDGLLVQRIVAKWKRPKSARNGMSVEIVIKMNRNGDIRSVEVARSSGDKAFDDSATAAIKAVKAMPEVAKIKDETYQSLYKERRVAFSPENLSS